jgi:hypothetical protein
MIYPFGKSFTRTFYPSQNGDAIQAQGTPISIYIFSDEPSRVTGAAGTGAVQTVSSWTVASTEPYGCSYTVPAIVDPDPTSSTFEEEYWEAINYRLASGGQTQTVIRKLILARVFGSATVPEVTDDDIKKLYPAIQNYLGDTAINDFVDQALDELKLELTGRAADEGKTLDWGRMENLSQLKIPLQYKAAALACLSQFHKDRDDKFMKRFELFSKMSSDYLSFVPIAYDSDGDGTANENTTSAGGGFFSGR